MFKLYDESIRHNNDYNEIIHSSIVFNALVFALYHIDEDQYKDLLWADSIKYRTETETALREFDLTDKSRVFELAQALLEDPYQRMFNHLDAIAGQNAE